ncbi:uncharacterized protein N7496_012476 [Penicillium cataractarum]|uniref:Uncharacterized protein n=1 Tax=Penicillium cataractarum TaxID=2100454 RepID=A0A9W9RAJ5_9EURO|nr:uncharacterized protein N7496_012476 [Penicillium cataractarum]KAJ5355264.1 hypothetical protein N7496_012476 [Penicillium cataractarum]
MDPHDPPESQPRPQPEDETATPSTETDELDLPDDMLAEIDTVLQNTPAPPIDPINTPPGRRVALLRESQWTVRVPPWRELMLLTPLREPINNRIINIQEAFTLKSFLDSRIRKRHAMLAQAVGVKANPPCVERQKRKDAEEYEKMKQNGGGQVQQTFTSVWKLPKK